MRIGIDARTILSPEKGDAIGVGHYTYQLIRHLLDLDKENEYVLLFDFRVREKDIKKFTRPNSKIRFYPFSDYKKYLPGAYNEILGMATLVREKLDLLHATSPSSRIPLGYRGKTLVTFHDLAVYKIPELFPKIYRAKNRAVLSMMADKADRIITVSNSTKKDVQEIFGLPEKKMEVIYSGLDRRFFDAHDVPREKILGRYGVTGKYILFLGTLEPVKNIGRLFEAFKIFKNSLKKENGKSDYKLIMAGKKGWLGDEYKQMAKDLGIGKDVIFTGYVIGDDLVPLFRNADFFVMPSLYEGFGSTILEAFATETPTIVSNVSSIPELVDSAAELVNPLDVNEIARAMLKLAKDEKVKEYYRQRGKEQAKKFDWEKCARETLEIYKSLV